jgi:hypothetical protein
MANRRDKIVQAMEELLERRDNGELAHLILNEVASVYGVSSAALREKAEASWGAPLETDHDRNLEHFELLENKRKIIEQGKAVAAEMWRVWAAYIEKYSERGIDCERDVKTLVESSNLNQPQLENLAEEVVLKELRRLIALQKAGQILPPEDSFSLG